MDLQCNAHRPNKFVRGSSLHGRMKRPAAFRLSARGEDEDRRGRRRRRMGTLQRIRVGVLGRSCCWGELLEVVRVLVFHRLRGAARKVTGAVGGTVQALNADKRRWPRWLFSKPLFEVLRQSTKVRDRKASRRRHGNDSHLRRVTAQFVVGRDGVAEGRGVRAFMAELTP